jgi:hypothetical protein
MEISEKGVINTWNQVNELLQYFCFQIQSREKMGEKYVR